MSTGGTSSTSDLPSEAAGAARPARPVGPTAGPIHGATIDTTTSGAVSHSLLLHAAAIEMMEAGAATQRRNTPHGAAEAEDDEFSHPPAAAAATSRGAGVAGAAGRTGGPGVAGGGGGAASSGSSTSWLRSTPPPTARGGGASGRGGAGGSESSLGLDMGFSTLRSSTSQNVPLATPTTTTTETRSSTARATSSGMTGATQSTPTTTTTTGSSSTPDRKMTHQLPVGQGFSARGASAARGAAAAADVEWVDAAALKDWATPEELHAMRTMLVDLKARHAAQVNALTRQLEEASRERDALKAHVDRSAELRALYERAKEQQDREEQARNEWREEREFMVLRVQEATNEVIKWREHVQKLRAAGLRGIAHGGAAHVQGQPTQPPLQGEDAQQQSTISASTAASDAAFLERHIQAEALAAATQLSTRWGVAEAEMQLRAAQETAEARHRADMSALAHGLERQELMCRIRALEAERAAGERRHATARAHATECENRMLQLQERVDTLEAANATLEQAVQKMESAQAERGLALVKDPGFATERAAFDTEHARLQALLSRTAADAAAQRDALIAAATATDAARQRAEEEMRAMAEAVEADRRAMHEQLQQEALRAADQRRRERQQADLIATERDRALRLHADADAKATLLEGRLAAALDAIAQLRGETEVTQRALAVTQTALATKEEMLQAAQAAAIEGELLARHARQLEEEIAATSAACERRCQHADTAVGVVQRARDEELQLAAELMRAQRARWAKKHKRLKALLGDLSLNKMSRVADKPERSMTEGPAPFESGVRTSAPLAPTPDVLEVMRANVRATAAMLQAVAR